MKTKKINYTISDKRLKSLKETLDKAQQIMKEYIPRFWNSDNYGWMILGVMMDNPDWTRAMITFVETNEQDNKKMITQTLMHDIGGLMRDDEHFVPRIHQDINCVIVDDPLFVLKKEKTNPFE